MKTAGVFSVTQQSSEPCAINTTGHLKAAQAMLLHGVTIPKGGCCFQVSPLDHAFAGKH